MMYLLQDLYIFILNNIFKITGKLKEKTRNMILLMASFVMVVMCMLHTAWYYLGIDFGYAELFAVNTLILLILIIFSIKDQLVRIKWNKFIAIPWFICPVLILVSCLDHHNAASFMMFAVLMLIAFPSLFFVWNNRGDYATLYIIFSKAVSAGVILFFVYCMICHPYDGDTAYQGISVNPNSNGLIAVGGAIASLYMLLVESTYKSKIIYIISLGMSVTLSYISLSRASIISIIMVFAVFIIYIIRIRFRDKRTIAGIAAVVVIIAVTFASVGVYKAILVNVTPHISQHIGEVFISEVYADDASKNPLIQKFQKSDNIDVMTSGRTVIWKNYLKEINVLGNERGDRGLYIDEIGMKKSAHNTYIEIAYRSGIFAGISYLIVVICAVIFSMRAVFGKKYFDIYNAFIPMSVVAFFVLSNIERAVFPVEKIHIFMFFIAITPLFSMKFICMNKKEINDDPYSEI